jgi:hypothetical protein
VLPGFARCAPAVFPKAVLARRAERHRNVLPDAARCARQGKTREVAQPNARFVLATLAYTCQRRMTSAIAATS